MTNRVRDVTYGPIAINMKNQVTLSKTCKMCATLQPLLLLVTASSYAAAFGFGGDAAFGSSLANKKSISVKSTAAAHYAFSHIEKHGVTKLQPSMVENSKKRDSLDNILISTVPFILMCIWMTVIPNVCWAEPSAGNTGQLIFESRCIKCHAGHHNNSEYHIRCHAREPKTLIRTRFKCASKHTAVILFDLITFFD